MHRVSGGPAPLGPHAWGSLRTGSAPQDSVVEVGDSGAPGRVHRGTGTSWLIWAWTGVRGLGSENGGLGGRGGFGPLSHLPSPSHCITLSPRFHSAREIAVNFLHFGQGSQRDFVARTLATQYHYTTGASLFHGPARTFFSLFGTLGATCAQGAQGTPDSGANYIVPHARANFTPNGAKSSLFLRRSARNPARCFSRKTVNKCASGANSIVPHL